MQETKACTTIKDHKDFPNKIFCCLINPSKSNIGKISKVILDKINNIVQSRTSVNQCKDTLSVIEWFINIKNKEISSFFLFDIESFYPSISEDLFKSSIQFAKKSIDISDYNLSLINQAQQTLLLHKNATRVKKEGNKDFDVPMGCFDMGEVCKLVGTYIPNQFKDTFQHCYRDDGLAVVKGLSGPEIQIMKKRIIKIFKDCGLKIAIKAGPILESKGMHAIVSEKGQKRAKYLKI